MDGMPTAKRRPSSAKQRYQEAVATYVAAGGDESVQRVITAVNSLTRKLDQWYARQLVDLDLSPGEWAVVTELAKAEGQPVTPSRLADAGNVAASSMTHRLDKMTERGLVRRSPDPDNRTRVLVELTDEGWQLFVAAVREANVVESDVLAGLTKSQRSALADLLEVVIADLDALDT
ncbi:DNA-binding MarR family transcriptional regulator [Knoellia remsis]|uniref:DNA-binding MarR family transcriptional regulator n=1 Tax=Knoellia remsis TaxID=407159 RepID=A0A2T0V0D0_9MICO|nr:MarR family transcriptional regulator [Knoellia remsis]PRY63604.1 DNA-binding MarR family transcriptional regulator [Knoellia remsis]